MSFASGLAKKSLESINKESSIAALIQKLKNKGTSEADENLFFSTSMLDPHRQQKRVEHLHSTTNEPLSLLSGEKISSPGEHLGGKVENYIGMSQVPTGVIGPLNILGAYASGDVYVPLATTEGALIASYQRGARATRLSGGITSVFLVEGVQRSPVFKFRDLSDLGLFLLWMFQNIDVFKKITTESSGHAKLNEVKPNIEGNHLIVTFEYLTGDAAGQNMVTFCTEQICQYILANAPAKPVHWFLEGNYAGDKKATSVSFSNVRGKKVTAEAVIRKEVLTSILKTNAELMTQYWQTSTIGVIHSGAIGAQGHFANGLAALFIATGQDVACVAEASNGITRMEACGEDLYVSVTLPSLIVGTVGGGTSLPTQRECLSLMDCYGEGKSRKFAEICGALVLAGEVSIAAALSAGHFSRAHKLFGRKRHNSSNHE